MFKECYLEVVGELGRRWSEDMQMELSVHNSAWGGGFNFINYLENSFLRYFNALQMTGGVPASFCDVGGFFGAFPITLKRLGCERVCMTEAMKYYGKAFDPLFRYITNEGVEIFDVDPTATPSWNDKPCEVVSLMAILEHIADSPEILLRYAKSVLAKSGVMIVEVPNIAYLPKRVGLLLGRSPLPHISHLLDSKVPFIGHHHEYTIEEVEHVVRSVGMEVKALRTFNYSFQGTWIEKIKSLPSSPSTILSQWFPSAREVIMVAASFPGV